MADAAALPLINKVKIENLDKRVNEHDVELVRYDERIEQNAHEIVGLENRAINMHKDVLEVKKWAKRIAVGVWGLFLAGIPIIVELLRDYIR